MSYYRSSIEDISAPEVRQIFDDLLFMVSWEAGSQFQLRTYDWFLWFFNVWKGGNLQQKHLPYVSPLSTKISKLVKTEVHVFYAELCRERGYGPEEYDNLTLLSFLKKVYRTKKR
jgi:hypothetical protein